MYFPDLADSFNFSGNRQMENLQKNWDRNLAQSLNMGEKELVAQESKLKHVVLSSSSSSSLIHLSETSNQDTGD